jgi:copper chaperone CopZ
MNTTNSTAVVTDYTVTGMTCGHCAASVTEELQELVEVESVEVDVPTGRVTVTSSAAVPPERVAAAVTEAGFGLVGA